MRTISPTKAVSHALNSVIAYRGVALRIGRFWVPVLVIADIAEIYAGLPDPMNVDAATAVTRLAAAAVGFVAFCSMAVNWHRFILRDDEARPGRLDGPVWHYAATSLAIMIVIVLPMLFLLYAAIRLPSGAVALLIMAVLAAGAVVTGLSIRLPAVALGRTDFSFAGAWRACRSNFWQLMGIFLLNGAVFFAAALAMVVILTFVSQFSAAAALAAQVVLAVIFQVFYTLFNASIFTSLYGFYVEGRDF